MQDTLDTITHVPAALDQRGRGRQPKLVDLLVDGRIFGNVSVRGGDVSLRLVIIIVGDKILHCVIRELLLEFSVQLSSQCFMWAMTSVGLFNAWITLAIVKVFPEPVTPQ